MQIIWSQISVDCSPEPFPLQSVTVTCSSRNVHSFFEREERRRCRYVPRMTTGEDGAKEQRPPARVAVFTLDSSTVYSVCIPLHRRMLWISDRGSSNDIASLVGGAVDRIFQPLRDQIDHHIPSCTAIVWAKEHAPNHKAAKALTHRDQALRLVLKPSRIIAPSRLRAHLRERANGRKFAAPSDDLHHIACLSSVRACGALRLCPRSCGRPSWPW